VRLFGFGDSKVGLRDDFDVERRQQLSKLSDLAGVVGGEDEFFHLLPTPNTEAQRAQRTQRKAIRGYTWGVDIVNGDSHHRTPSSFSFFSVFSVLSVPLCWV
jgi:hypothetical protein